MIAVTVKNESAVAVEANKVVRPILASTTAIPREFWVYRRKAARLTVRLVGAIG